MIWNPHDVEVSVAANGLSLMMPFAEPYLADSIEAAIPALAASPDNHELLEEVIRFVHEERAHQKVHRRYHDRLCAATPSLRYLERSMGFAYGALARHGGAAFGVAFAAASETVAFSIARWTSHHLDRFAGPADPDVVRMFFWHLNEEVGHKSVAHDVWAVTPGRRVLYPIAATLTLVFLACFVGAACLAQLGRRLINPLTWWRLVAASVSVAFEVLPTLAASALRSHDPRGLSDPVGLACVR